MADEVRELLRAAQQAELRGSVDEAAELLWRAARMYDGRGRRARALQLLRYAQKLSPTFSELSGEIDRLEGGAEPEDNPAGSLQAKMQEILGEVEAVASAALPGVDRLLVERLPQLAVPTLAAWCSFCCKPKDEVGPLVAGPAGAFICTACSALAQGLLGGDAPPAPRARPPLRSVPAPTSPAAPRGLLPSQLRALEALGAAVASGGRRILLLGGRGVGKSHLLEVATKTLGGASIVEGPWLPGEDRLPESASVVVLAWPSVRPLDATTLTTSHGAFAWPTTRALLAAAPTLPEPIALRIDRVVVLAPPSPPELRAHAAARLEALGVPAALRKEACAKIVQAVRSSDAGLHELEALVRRIPPDATRLGAGRGGARGKKR